MTIVIAFGLTIILVWFLRGYIEHERYYYQMMVLEYIDRNDLPFPTSEDLDESKANLDKRYWKDLMDIIVWNRFPFNRIPGKYLPTWR